MGLGEQLTITQKLRKIRKSKGIKQMRFAEILHWDVSRISEIETGRRHYCDKQLTKLRAFLEIEDAPVTDDELVKFKRRLYVWRDLIRDRRINEAENLRKELAVISKLPYEKDLNLLYKMFEISQLLRQDDVNDNLQFMAEALDETEPFLDEASEETKHHFYCNKGLLCYYRDEHEKSTTYYKAAISTEDDGYEKEPTVYYNLALAYSHMGMAVRALSIILDSYNLFDHHRTSIIGLRIDNTLAVNYIRTNQIGLALKVLDRAVDKASSLADKTFLDITLHNYGAAYFQAGDYEKALQYFNEAFEHIDKNNSLYLENYFAKVHTLITIKNKALYSPLLLKAKTVARANEHYTLLFDSLSHALTAKELRSVEFIENITLPYLVNNYQYSRALYFCNVLIEAHDRSKRSKRVLEIKGLKADILEKIMFGSDNI